ncbi:MAG: DNA-binding protein, partial [Candidatus Marinimicrobia bacterium]|nr:DNA-binding protein [Candidatus Neomarinimicrobiota bacterium]MBL7059452.1 DNA-binding protein [Candidatus Neomarinimicrobiota bacterium]
MQYKHIDDTYFVFIQKDEFVNKTLTEFCKNRGIQTAEISGIGAVKDIEIGAYDPVEKKYITKTYSKTYELISFNGNITLKDGEPFVHAHLTLGDHDMNILGGHLFEMKVAVVGEFIIKKVNVDIHRKLDSEIGLATWNLS